MVSKIALTLCILLLVAFCSEAQREGRRRNGRRKPTTEMPPEEEELEVEKSPQKLDTEPESVVKPSSAQSTETEDKIDKELAADKEPTNSNQGGRPFIVPRGTRKPRPQMRSNGEARPKPTLPTFARKRGPKHERRDFKKAEESAEETKPTSTSTTMKPIRNSSRNRNTSSRRNTDFEKAQPAQRSPDSEKTQTSQRNPDSSPTENHEEPIKKRFGGGLTRRPASRGNKRYNPDQES